MKAISQFVVHVFDLIEAEGAALLTAARGEARRVRLAATNLAMGSVFLIISIPLFVGGFGLLGAALMWSLETVVSRPLAACLTGLAVLAAAAGCLLGFKLLAGRRQP